MDRFSQRKVMTSFDIPGVLRNFDAIECDLRDSRSFVNKGDIATAVDKLSYVQIYLDYLKSEFGRITNIQREEQKGSKMSSETYIHSSFAEVKNKLDAAQSNINRWIFSTALAELSSAIMIINSIKDEIHKVEGRLPGKTPEEELDTYQSSRFRTEPIPPQKRKRVYCRDCFFHDSDMNSCRFGSSEGYGIQFNPSEEMKVNMKDKWPAASPDDWCGKGEQK